jgi:hypothetical protein
VLRKPRPMMIVDSRWNRNRKMTAGEEAAYFHWDDDVHADDLLRGSGIVRVIRYRPMDNSGTLHIQEYESEEALETYLTSQRRKELIDETQSHYPAGEGPEYFFDSRSVRCFIPVSSKGED